MEGQATFEPALDADVRHAGKHAAPNRLDEIVPPQRVEQPERIPAADEQRLCLLDGPRRPGAGIVDRIEREPHRLESRARLRGVCITIEDRIWHEEHPRNRSKPRPRGTTRSRRRSDRDSRRRGAVELLRRSSRITLERLPGQPSAPARVQRFDFRALEAGHVRLDLCSRCWSAGTPGADSLPGNGRGGADRAAASPPGSTGSMRSFS